MKKAEIVKSVNGLFSKTSFQLKKHTASRKHRSDCLKKRW